MRTEPVHEAEMKDDGSPARHESSINHDAAHQSAAGMHTDGPQPHEEMHVCIRLGAGRLAAYAVGCLLAHLVLCLLVPGRLPIVLSATSLRTMDWPTTRALVGCVHLATALASLVLLDEDAGFLAGLATTGVPLAVVFSTHLACTRPTALLLSIAVGWLGLCVFRSCSAERGRGSASGPWSLLRAVAQGLRTGYARFFAAIAAGFALMLLAVFPIAKGSVTAAREAVGSRRIEEVASDYLGVATFEVSPQEMAQGAQNIVHAECIALGIPEEDEPTVCIGYMGNLTAAGYSPLANTITLDASFLYEMLDWPFPTSETLHELAHAQQWRAVLGKVDPSEVGIAEDVDADRVGRWRREFLLYPLLASTVEGHDGLDVERTADDFARGVAQRVYEHYDRLLEERRSKEIGLAR